MSFGADQKEVLMNGNSIATTGDGKMRLNIGFDVFSSGSMLDAEQIEHEFGDGVGGGQVGGVDMRRVESGDDLVPVAVFGEELVSRPAQFKPVGEEMMKHVHTAALAMLEDDDGNAGRRHPGNEAFKVREPLLGRDVIEGMGGEH